MIFICIDYDPDFTYDAKVGGEEFETRPFDDEYLLPIRERFEATVAAFFSVEQRKVEVRSMPLDPVGDQWSHPLTVDIILGPPMRGIGAVMDMYVPPDRFHLNPQAGVEELKALIDQILAEVLPGTDRSPVPTRVRVREVPAVSAEDPIREEAQP